MKAHYYLAIGVRLFAIALIVNTLNNSGLLIELIITGYINGISTPLLPIFASTIVPLLIAIVLWFFPVIISRSIIKPETNEDVEITEKSIAFYTLISVLGLFFTFYASVDLIYYFKLWHIAQSAVGDFSMQDVFNPEIQSNVWATVFELILGLLCVFKSKTVANKINSVVS
jgi:hypothetical protein